MKKIFFVCCALLHFLDLACADSQLSFHKTNEFPLDIQTNTSFPFTVIDDEIAHLVFYYSFDKSNYSTTVLEPFTDDSSIGKNKFGQSKKWFVQASLDYENIAELKGGSEVVLDPEYSNGNFSISIKGKLPGRVTLLLCGFQSNHSLCESFKLFVERRQRPIDLAFNIVLVLLVVLTNIGMGAKIDLSVMKAELKRPIAPAIGLCCQFIIMPLIAFGVANCFTLDPGITLGFFALGCAPGGSASNAYTYLLGGNVSLSVTMTLISTFAALGLLPMWLFTLGKVVYNTGDVKIPYENIFLSLLGIIVPAVIGLFLQRKFPKVAKVCVDAVKYIVVVMVVFILTVGVYANVYVFYLLSGEVLLAAALLPYLGFLLGGLVASIFRLGKVNIITIAVETGIQNTGIPIVLLRLSLVGPDKDTSIVAPVASAMFTPLPLIIGVIYVQTQLHLEKRRKERENAAAKAVQNRREEPDIQKSPTDNIRLVSDVESPQA